MASTYDANDGGVHAVVSAAATEVVVRSSGEDVPTCGDVVLFSDASTVITRFSNDTHKSNLNPFEVGAYCYNPDNLEISTVSPTMGQEGTAITITGRFPPRHGVASALTTALVAGNNATVESSGSFSAIIRLGAGMEGDTGPVRVMAETGAFAVSTVNVTYVAPGNITNVTPTAGQHGTRITITGTGFFGLTGTAVTAVLVDSVPAIEIVMQNDTYVVARLGAGSANAAAVVRVESDDGSYTLYGDTFEKLADGTVAAITPAAAQPTRTISITGTNLMGDGTTFVSHFLGTHNVTANVVGTPTNSLVVIQVPDGVGFAQYTATSETGSIVQSGAQGFAFANITSITPSQGQAGTRITLAGFGMTSGAMSASSVLLGTAAATVVSSSATQIVATVGSASAGTVFPTVVGTNGYNVSSTAVNFTYLPPQQINAVTPYFGQHGTRVNISGVNLLGGGSTVVQVMLDGINATIESQSDTEIIVRAGVNDPGEGDVVVITDTGARVTRTDGFLYIFPGSITTISPSSGQVGTHVTLSGTSLIGGGTQLASATVAGVAASILSATDIQVVVQLAEGAATMGTVRLTADTGAIVSSAGMFTYIEPGNITAVSPAQGVLGTTVTITGTNLLGGAMTLSSVTIGNVSATVTSATNTQVVVQAGHKAASMAPEDIVITASTGARINGTALFTYQEPGVIAQVQPSSGAFGTRITITGTNLRTNGTAVTNVTLNGVQATVVSENSTRVVITAGSFAGAGAGDVKVFSNLGTYALLSNGFTYVGPPLITDVSPAVGITGSEVTVTGSSLLAGGTRIVRATLANVNASQILIGNRNFIVVLVAGQNPNPSANTTGDVVLYTDTGAVVTLAGAFRYQPDGNITRVTPAMGQVGTRVTIQGTELLGNPPSQLQYVLLGDIRATIVSATDAEVIVTAGSSVEAGPVTVLLHTESGADITLPFGFTYVEEGAIFSITPSSGQVGTVVTIQGNNLLSGGAAISTALFGSTAATVLNATSTRVTVRVQNATASMAQNVRLTADTGGFVLRERIWTYLQPGVVTAVNPPYGQFGTRVTITGERLLSGGSSVQAVRFGSVSHHAIESESPTQIVVRVGDNEGNLTAGSDITIVANTQASLTAQDVWQWTAPGNISTVQPNTGQYGTRITVTGTNLFGNGTALQELRVGTLNATVTNATSTRVVASINNNMATTGPVNVILESNTGALVVLGLGFTYTAVGEILSVSPDSGAAGTLVTISGQRLLGGAADVASVTLADVSATVLSANATQVVVEATTAAAAGAGDVVITGTTGALVSKTTGFTYVEAPNITDVTPAEGTFATRVTVTGTNLLAGGTAFVTGTVGGIPAMLTTADSNTQIVLVTPNVTALGAAQVAFTTDTGAVVQASNLFTYRARGSVASVTPVFGQVGTLVTITGPNLRSYGAAVDAVAFNGTAATISSQNNTHVIVAVGESSVEGLVNVRLTADTGAYIDALNAFTYVMQGNISLVSPNSGQVQTRVTITGTHLLGNGTSLASVTLAGVAVDSIEVQTSSMVVVRAGARTTAITGDVVLTADTGATVTLENGFSYITPGAITGISPAQGQLGTRITITGTGLFGGGSAVQNVTFGGVDALAILSATNASVVARAPVMNAGAVAIAIISDTGATTTSTAGAFTFDAPSAISSISPSSGTAGTLVTVTGTSLFGVSNGASIVAGLFGTANATVQSFTSTQVVLVAPQSAASNVTITIDADSGARTVSTDMFRFLAPGNITDFAPKMGVTGTHVTIVGSNLLGGASTAQSVTVAGVAASVVSATASSIVAALGEGTTQAGPIVVTGGEGSLLQSAAQFQYINQSVILSVSPSSGQSGTAVQIVGEALRAGGVNVSSVTLAGIAATIVSENDTVVSVTAGVNPSGNATTGDVVVSASNGGRTVLANAFSYQQSGSIVSVVPSSGQGGTYVTITGTDLLAGGTNLTSVQLGTVQATIVSASSTTVVVRAGDGPAVQTAVDVMLTSNTNSFTSKTNGFTYLKPGEVFAVDPQRGQGGIQVRIGGVDLCGAGSVNLTSVTLANISATIDSEEGCFLVTVTAGTTDFNTSVVGDLVLVGNTGSTVRLQNAFTYVPSGLISSVSPGVGQGGQAVTVRGRSLLGGGNSLTAASLAGVPATVISANSTYVSLVANSGPISSTRRVGDVSLTSDIGVTVTATNGWSYAVISSIQPTSGQGGTFVTIAGQDLLADGAGITAVTLAGVRASSIVSANDTQVVVRAAAQAVTVNQAGVVELTTDNGQSVLSRSGLDNSDVQRFTYRPPGAITSVSPAQGQANTTVTITGTRLLGYGTSVQSVTFGNTTSGTVISGTDTKVVVVAPESADVGAVNITITSNTGAIVETDAAFTYVAQASISGATPGVGQGGTRVTVTGVSLLGGATTLRDVTLAGVSVREIVSFNDTQVVVVAAAHGSAVSGDVVVQSANGAFVSLVGGFNYSEPGAVASVSPDSGHAGTRVVIEGTRLLGSGSSLVSVTLGGVSVASIVSGNNTRVVVVAAAGSAGAGDVVLTANTGAEVIATGGFTYVAAGAIDQVQPASGQFGTRVTINGTNLLGGGSSAATVRLGGVAAMVVSGTSTEVVVVARSGSAGVGDVEIVADTGAVVSKSNAWEQLEDGVITSVVPAQAQKDARVTIQGARLLGGGQDIARAVLAGVDATYESGSGSDTEVVVVAALGTAGANGSVLLVADTGAEVSLSLGFEYVARGSISSVEPSTGSAGTLVTISGSNLLSGGASIEGVTLAGVAAAQVVSGNDTVIVVEAGQQSSAVSGMVVTTSDTGSTSVLSSGTAFTYIAPPSIDTVSPASGQEGTRVTLSGQNLLCGGSSVRTVTLAGVAVGTVVSESDTSVVVDAAPGAAGNGSVRIEADTGAFVELADGWTYIEAGSVSSVEPATGQRGSVVVIRGTNLLGGGSDVSSVTLAGVEVTSIDSANATVVVVVAGGRSTAGAGDVVLMSDTRATVTASGAFTYLEPGNITSVSPSVGQDGTRVVIEGERLLGDGDNVMSVTLAGVAATVTGASQSQINVTAHASTAKTGDVVVVGNTGIIVSSTNAWTFGTPGYVEGVDPGRGVAGTEVLIYGNNLLGYGSSVASVTLDGIAANITYQSDVLIKVIANDGVAGAAGDIVVTANTGAFGTAGNAWTYVSAPNITSVSPSSGTLGTLITIQGTSLLAGADSIDFVTLAGVTATITFQNDTLVVVRAGSGSARTGDVVISTDNGATIRNRNAFTFVQLGEIHSIEPTSGIGGTLVTITGSQLLLGAQGLSSVTLFMTAASVISASNSMVVVRAGTPTLPVVVQSAASANPTTGDVIVTATNGATIRRTSGFTYIMSPNITDITPPSGQVGTRVTIVGSGLLAGGSSVSNVTLAGVAAESVVSANDTSVVVVAGSGSPGNGSVTVTADTGASYSSDSVWTYVEASTIDSFAPVTGQEGTYVTIRGQRLFGGGSTVSRVVLAGVDAAVQAGGNSTYVVARAAASVAGAGRVVVESDTGARAVATGDFTYADAGVVTTLMPASGQRGTRVTIVGERLLGGAMSPAVVRLGGRAVMSVVSANSTMVVVRASNGTVGTGDVEIESVSGAIVRGVGLWEQLAEGQVTGVSPSSGAAGTLVTLFGSSLTLGSNTVTLLSGGVSTSVVSRNATHVVFELPASLPTGSVTFALRADTLAEASLVDQFTVLASGSVTSVVPSPSIQGARVTIHGTGLLGGGTAVTTALFASEAATILSSSETTVVVILPGLDAPGPVNITLVSDTGATVFVTNSFSYAYSPSIDTLAPTSGQEGTRVTLQGSLLLAGGSNITRVLLDGRDGTVLTSNDSMVTFAVPANAQGPAVVQLIADTEATYNLTSRFTYLRRPRISALAPSSGQYGTRVTVSGVELLGGGSGVASLTVAGQEAHSIESASNETIVFRAPQGTQGTQGTVVVTADTGAVARGTPTFSYVEAGSISTVSPSTGQAGTLVTVTGSNLFGLLNGTAVVNATLADIPVAAVVSSSATQVVLKAALSAVGMTGSVSLVADSGAIVARSAAWTYIAPGAITSVDPGVGQVGTYVTLRGTNLLGGGASATQVRFGGDAGTVVSGNSTVVVARGANGTAGTVGVAIVADTGATVSLPGAWLRLASGSVSSVAPAFGQGGTRVTITGVGLRGNGTRVTKVTLRGLEATVMSESDDQVVVAAAASPSAGVGDVVLESDTGAQVTSTSAWEYVEPARVDSVSPASGQRGTRVTVLGAGLLAGGANVTRASLGGTNATLLSANDTRVVLAAGDADPQVLVGLRLEMGSGAVVTHANAFTYLTRGNIDSVTPASASAGALVTITGSLCGGGSSIVDVLFDTFNSTIEASSCSQARVRVPDTGLNTSVSVSVVSDTGSIVELVGGFTYLADGAILSISPPAGQSGTVVEIRGVNMLGGSAGISSLKLAGSNVLVDVVSDTFINATVLTGSGQGDVTLVSQAGVTLRLRNGWTFSRVQQLEPNSGMRGTVVTIRGLALLAGGSRVASARLGGQPVASIVSNSSSEVVVEAAANLVTADTRGDVVLTMDNGQTVSRSNVWTYKPPGSIDLVEPGSGQSGTVVTISGTELLGYGTNYTSVSLSGVPVQSILSANNTRVVVVAAASATQQAGDVVLVSDTGSRVVLADGNAGTFLQDGLWQYVAPAELTSVSPAEGQVSTLVTVTGTGLRGGGNAIDQVLLSGVEADVVSESDTQLVVRAQAGMPTAVAGSIEILADTGARAVFEQAWRYVPAGNVSSVSPSTGQQGTLVTISGTRLRGNSTAVERVLLAGVEATVLSESDALVVVSAEASAGTSAGDVVLIGSTGATVTASTAFRYLTPANVTLVSPSMGQLGTLVTITGTALLGGGSNISRVLFNSTSSLRVLSASDTVVVAESPRSGVAGTVDLTLIADTGAFTAVTGGWTFLEPGVVDSVDPPQGQVGTSVTIRGRNLLQGAMNVTAVRFGDVLTRIMSFNSTQIIVGVEDGGVPGTTGTIRVTTETGAYVELVDGWTFALLATIDGVSPSSGHFGTLVNISGINLQAGGRYIATAFLAGVEVDSVVIADEPDHVVVVAGASTGAITNGDVVLVSDNGARTTLANAFSYVAPGNITSVSPGFGQYGTVVHIEGSNLLGGGSTLSRASLRFVDAVSIVSASNTEVVLVAAASQAGPGPVHLYADTGAVVSAECV
ncbi:hypothetical protein PTSG_03923 [Salpingoeca rosetta]|uniref:IPT/TIG domain-containing protein n=1 Tax=Salpingoeca rosetta (strain ATCC 50818 / BSB-021) TaxID=946362 RepID=F2U798_SALR5|nr:uncharacterized protein PTSG_03923 [Salpingoeca rosetta]EGD83315.1 hypothetical protein PTSG_03923 [Salpingoeca rosetta]|eukprot:XP_004994819.1 hypothetical protein PTSG_03923 [Salpingoeca rosetta]